MKVFLSVLFCIVLFTPAYAADDPFGKLDADGNGKIEKQEYLDSVSRSFDKADQNKDGSLDRKELKKAAPELNKKMKELDTDKDGRISKNEFTKGTLKEFDLIDSNKDGFIDKSEFEAFRKKEMEKGSGAKSFLRFYF